MHSFLGVPIVARGEVIGAFYLTDYEGAETSASGTRRLIEMLAAHAAVAIENARLLERSRELCVVEERNRLARELHDAVSQTLFGLVLTAEAASALVGARRRRRRREMSRLGELAQEALEELRGLIFQLRPATSRRGAGGDAAQAGRGARARARPRDRVRITGGAQAAPEAEGEGLRIAAGGAHQRAPPRRRRAHRAAPEGRDGRLTVTVADDGVGFDPAAPGPALAPPRADVDGERARALGGTLRSARAPARARR